MFNYRDTTPIFRARQMSLSAAWLCVCTLEVQEPNLSAKAKSLRSNNQFPFRANTDSLSQQADEDICQTQYPHSACKKINNLQY